MTRQEYEKLQQGQPVYFVEGGYPEGELRVVEDIATKKEKVFGIDMVGLKSHPFEALDFCEVFLSCREAEARLKVEKREDEKQIQNDIEETNLLKH